MHFPGNHSELVKWLRLSPGFSPSGRRPTCLGPQTWWGTVLDPWTVRKTENLLGKCITEFSLARGPFGQRDNLSKTTKLIIAWFTSTRGVYQDRLGRSLTFEFAQVECLSCSVTNLLYSGLMKVHSNWSDYEATFPSPLPTPVLLPGENCFLCRGLQSYISVRDSRWARGALLQTDGVSKTTKLINCLIHFHKKVCFDCPVSLFTLLFRTKESPIFSVYGHIMLKTPVLVWSLKLSNIEPC